MYEVCYKHHLLFAPCPTTLCVCVFVCLVSFTLCVCVCVSLSLSLYVCVSLSLSVCVCFSLSLSLCVCVCVCFSLSLCVCVCVCVSWFCMSEINFEVSVKCSFWCFPHASPTDAFGPVSIVSGLTRAHRVMIIKCKLLVLTSA